MVDARYKSVFLVFLFLSVFFCQSLYLANRASTTNDEGFHVKAGALYFQTGKFSGGFHNPPLLQTLLGMPDGLGLEPYDILKAKPPYWARYVNVFLGTLLAFAVYIVTCRFFGQKGGLLALGLFSLSPSLTAHSALATTDIGVSLWLFLFVALVAATRNGDRSLSHIFPGLALGAAVASKLTALSFIFLMPILYLGLALLNGKSLVSVLKPVGIVLLTVYLVFSAAYGLEEAFTSKQYIMPTRPLLMAAMFPLPKLAAEAIVGKMSFARGGCASYILGRKYRYGTIWFYPAVLLAKLPLGLLFALVFLAINLCRHFKELLSPVGLFLVLPALFLLLMMTVGNRHQTGVRHLFPIFPFLYVLLGSMAKWKSRYIPLVGLIVLAQIGAAVSTFPEGLAFVNTLGKALSTGPIPLAGPDCDWGQSDFVLRNYLSQLPSDEDIWVNPYPSAVPRAGWIAVSACSRIYGSGYNTVSYKWLENFPVLETVGGAWTIFHIGPDAYTQLAEAHPDDWDKQELLLSYLYHRKDFDSCAKRAKKVSARFPGSLFYRGRALLLSGRHEEAHECFKELAVLAGGSLTNPSALWQEMALYFAGKHRRPEKETTAFVFTMLNMLDEDVTKELRAKLRSKPIFAVPATTEEPIPWLRFAWVFIHRERQEWQKELALLVTLREFAFTDYVRNSIRPLRSIAESKMTDEACFIGQRLMEAANSPHWSRFAYEQLVEQYRKAPIEYDYIINIILIQMKRRATWAAYDGNMDSIYDELERNGRWIGK